VKRNSFARRKRFKAFAEPASHFFVCTNVAWPHSFGRLGAHRRAEFRVNVKIER
jgi:hypothetical protein